MDAFICSTCRRPHDKKVAVSVIYTGRYGAEAKLICPKCASLRKKNGER